MVAQTGCGPHEDSEFFRKVQCELWPPAAGAAAYIVEHLGAGQAPEDGEEFDRLDAAMLWLMSEAAGGAERLELFVPEGNHETGTMWVTQASTELTIVGCGSDTILDVHPGVRSHAAESSAIVVTEGASGRIEISDLQVLGGSTGLFVRGTGADTEVVVRRVGFRDQMYSAVATEGASVQLTLEDVSIAQVGVEFLDHLELGHGISAYGGDAPGQSDSAIVLSGVRVADVAGVGALFDNVRVDLRDSASSRVERAGRAGIQLQNQAYGTLNAPMVLDSGTFGLALLNAGVSDAYRNDPVFVRSLILDGVGSLGGLGDGDGVAIFRTDTLVHPVRVSGVIQVSETARRPVLVDNVDIDFDPSTEIVAAVSLQNGATVVGTAPPGLEVIQEVPPIQLDLFLEVPNLPANVGATPIP